MQLGTCGYWLLESQTNRLWERFCDGMKTRKGYLPDMLSRILLASSFYSISAYRYRMSSELMHQTHRCFDRTVWLIKTLVHWEDDRKPGPTLVLPSAKLLTFHKHSTWCKYTVNVTVLPALGNHGWSCIDSRQVQVPTIGHATWNNNNNKNQRCTCFANICTQFHQQFPRRKQQKVMV